MELERMLDTLAAARRLARVDVAEPGWRFWERRTLNIHRVVALGSGDGEVSAAELGEHVRAVLGRHFRRAWWRGLGFGVVLAGEGVRLAPDESRTCIDGRENSRGTWQWLVQVGRVQRAAVGVHTWVEGYLSPVYRGLLDALATNHEVVRLVKERDGLMRLLTSTKPGLFPEFRDGGRDARSA